MLYKTYKLKSGKTLEIHTDEGSANNPRNWDNLGTMVCFHRRYNLGDKHDYDHNDYKGWSEMFKAIEKNEDALIILPLYLYDHSGITISTSPFDCQWDSGQVGFIFVSKEKVRKEYNVKRISPKIAEKALSVLEGEVKTYDQYITGDVYGFKVINEEGDEEDSCWGFFGDDIKENGILDHVGEEVVE